MQRTSFWGGFPVVCDAFLSGTAMWQPWKCTSQNFSCEDYNWWMATSGNAESTITLTPKAILPMSCFHNYRVWWRYWGRWLPARLQEFSDSWLWLKNSHWLSQNFLNVTVLDSLRVCWSNFASFLPSLPCRDYPCIMVTSARPLFPLQLFPLVSGEACIMLPWCLLLKRPNIIMQDHIYGEGGLQTLSMCSRMQP